MKQAFKRLLFAALILAIALTLGVMCQPARAAAVWDINLFNQYGSDAPFSLVGTFTTADANVQRGTGEQILSFNAMINGVQTSLVPLGVDLAFDYDNLFYGPTDIAAGWSTLDAFDYRGIVLTVPGDTFNLYSGGALIGLYATGASLALDGTITFDRLTSVVTEPDIAMMISLTLALLMIPKRKRDDNAILPGV